MKIARFSASLLVVAMLFFTACKPGDEKIHQGVVEVLKANPGVLAEVKGGVVTLTGEVADEAAKSAAEALVKSVKGVTSVVNNVSLKPAISDAITSAAISSDELLSKAVKDALKDFPGITAAVKEGVIAVSGKISAEKWKVL